jgi:hypothetical protein
MALLPRCKTRFGGCSQASSDAFGMPPPLKVSEAVAEFIFIWFGNRHGFSSFGALTGPQLVELLGSV